MESRRQFNWHANSRVALTCLIVVLCCLLVGSAAGEAGGQPTVGEHSPDAPITSLQEPTPDVGNETANTTIRHNHPDEIDEDGDVEAVADWLSADLAARLGESTAQLNEGEYDSAREHLDGEYEHRLGQLAELAQYTNRQTEDGENRDERAVAEFRSTNDRQEAFIASVEAYEETAEQYEEAQDADDAERARELARELEDLEDRVTDQGSSLEQNYETLDSVTGLDFEDETTQINNTQATISERQAEIRAAEFRETTVTITETSEQASFLNPLTISGTVVDEEDEPVPNTTVQLGTEQHVNTTTDETGAFTLSHRPALQPLSTDSVPVTVLPDPASLYLASETNASVALTAETPTIQITEAPETGAFTDEVQVNATMTVTDVPVEDVPVQLQLDGEQLAETRTDASGTVSFHGSVPATVPPGNATLAVVFPFENRTVTTASETTTVTITETDTTLQLDGEAQSSRSIAITGQLMTETGVAVTNEPVEVAVDGVPFGTVRTDGDGAIEASIPLTNHTDELTDRNVTVTASATYDAPSTNLNRSYAETNVTVTLPSETTDLDSVDAADETSSGSILEALLGWLIGGDASESENGPGSSLAASPLMSPWSLLFGGIAVLSITVWALAGAPLPDRVSSLLASIGALLPFGTSDPSSSPTETDDVEEQSSDVPLEPSTTGEPPTTLLTARELITTGETDEAMILAYETARKQLADSGEYPTALTHWEFLRATQENGLDEETASHFRELTDGYERATFAPNQLPAADAEAAVDTAMKLVDS